MPEAGTALAPPNVLEVTVSELSAALKRTLEDAYGYVRVRGELGKVSYHSNGHVYFDLKDERACISGVVWRTAAARIRLKLEAGLEVVVTGRITTYAGRSQYQIIVDTLQPAGLGALMALMEERKRRLAEEGLFAEARKQLLPFLPEVIGVITSPTGAVIRDILHRLSDRFPRRVLVWPVKVQGDGSAEQVAAAIHGFNALPLTGRIGRPDLIIVARGGGSLEDLWSFNDEAVVRATAASMIPLISAVGHETDVTLIDFAADRRAPTPTAAAEMAVPVRAELIAHVDGLSRRKLACWLERQQRRRTELRGLARALPTADRMLGDARQKLDVAAARLPRALHANAQIHERQLVRAAAALTAYSPGAHAARLGVQLGRTGDRLGEVRLRMFGRARERFRVAAERLSASLRANRTAHVTRLARDRQSLARLYGRLLPAWEQFADRRAAAVDRACGLLDAFSYHGVLQRGFALVRDTERRPLRSSAVIAPGQPLEIEFFDGRVRAITTDAASPAVRVTRVRRRRRAADPEQGNLFGG